MSKNIIYLCDSEKKPSGGVKVIYQQSNFIDSLKNFNSFVTPIKKKFSSKLITSLKKKIRFGNQLNSGWRFKDITVKKNFKSPWFNHKIRFKNTLKFKESEDFVILPEIFAHFAEELLIKNNISYAIFVQNHFSIFSSSDKKKTLIAYKKAKFIISNSSLVTKTIKKKFPNLRKKIFNIIISVNEKNFHFSKRKKNIISYMPRKKIKQSKIIIDSLKKKLPQDWEFIKVDNAKENEVGKIFSKSKIFLSFSYNEGLGLPPIEAALTGNKVIGFSGEGGGEYWRKPIFSEAGKKDNFLTEIIKFLRQKNFFKTSENQRNFLRKKYSKIGERKSILRFLKFV